MDLSHTELRKSAQSASITKLQSLLDLALNTDSGGPRAESGHVDDLVFREDLKVTMVESGLYEWLLKVANVSALDGAAVSGPVDGRGQREKEKDDKKPMLGEGLKGNVVNCSLIYCF